MSLLRINNRDNSYLVLGFCPKSEIVPQFLVISIMSLCLCIYVYYIPYIRKLINEELEIGSTKIDAIPLDQEECQKLIKEYLGIENDEILKTSFKFNKSK